MTTAPTIATSKRCTPWAALIGGLAGGLIAWAAIDPYYPDNLLAIR